VPSSPSHRTATFCGVRSAQRSTQLWARLMRPPVNHFAQGTPPDWSRTCVYGSANSMPILIGAATIAAAILLSTLITAVGTRFAGVESPSEENLWLIDRLTGNVYKCQAAERGKALCEPETATGSIGERGKR